MTNYFQLFSIKPSFSIDLRQLESAYQAQITQFHPDKFAAQSAEKKTIAVQNTSLINSAYDTLKSPLKRATYLLELENINAFDETNTNMDSDFLLMQIEYREALERFQADTNIDEIEGFVDKIDTFKKQYITNIATYFDNNQLEKVKNKVRELKFFEQLQQQANAFLDEHL